MLSPFFFSAEHVGRSWLDLAHSARSGGREELVGSEFIAWLKRHLGYRNSVYPIRKEVGPD
jgi:hypothetical protein